ncbi:MAG: recombinase family protein [Acholeplasmataceae bacterium]|jgi:site-specific DNA recombinase
MNEQKVTTIPVFKTIDEVGNIKKKRVAAYVRVSTKSELQSNSFTVQTTNYYNEILNNKSWEYAGVFADHGKSGTNITRRVNFIKMVELAKMGEIDLIITKSISRFTRDVIDGVTTIQDLRSHGVEVFFEKEQISSLDPSFDMILTILTSLSEEESKSNSNNVLWTYKKKMREGGNTTPRLFGYTIKNGEFIINEKEASTVKLIYKLFLEGLKTNEIINELEKRKHLTRSGNKRFAPSVVRTILRNEKYIGDMKLQKTTVKNVGARSSVVNKTKPSYYVRNNHEPIIDREIFAEVQNIISSRQKLYKPKSKEKITEHKYSNFVYSLMADKFYKSKVNHRGKPYQVMLLELLDNQKDRILDVKNIYYSQIDILINEVATTINKNIRDFRVKVLNHFNDSYENSTLVKQMLNLELELKEIIEKEKAITSSSIVDSAKKEMMAKLENETDLINIKLIELKHKQIMAFNYQSGLKLFLNQIKDYQQHEAKDIFLSIVAVNREDLNVILKLSNKSDVDIDYNEIIESEPVYQGSFEFKQTRLHLTTKWKLFLT